MNNGFKEIVCGLLVILALIYLAWTCTGCTIHVHKVQVGPENWSSMPQEKEPELEVHIDE